MPPSKSVAKAEGIALSGKNESQDSQQVLDAYKRMYGIGFMSSSPNPAAEMAQPKAERIPSRKDEVIQNVSGMIGNELAMPQQISESAPTNERDLEKASTGAPQGNAGDQALASREQRQPPSGRSANSSLDWDAENRAGGVERKEFPVESPNPLHKADVLPQLPRSSLLRKKMDFSQSPTQSNDDRSYEKYCKNSPSRTQNSVLRDDTRPVLQTQSTSYEQRTLDDEDTGAVVFDFDQLAAARSLAPILDESSVPGYSASARPTNLPSEDGPVLHFEPETPAPPQNPFAVNSHSQLLHPSQLFGGTQFSTAVRKASPTSSRPSPDIFHQANSTSPNRPISSPLKARGIRSTPPIEPTSSPQVLDGILSRPQDAEDTPLNTGPSKAQPVLESPESPRKRFTLAPLAEYEPMRDSQERRSAFELPSDIADYDEDLDTGDIRRRLRAKSKKEAAAKRLASINFNRPVKPEDIEVPLTNKKKTKRQADVDGHATHRYGRNPVDGDSHETVADSQEQRLNVENRQSREEGYDEFPDRSSDDDGLIASTAPIPPTPVGIGQYPVGTAAGDPSSREAIPETSPVERQLPLNKVTAASSGSVSNFSPQGGVRYRTAKQSSAIEEEEEPGSKHTVNRPRKSSPSEFDDAPASSLTELPAIDRKAYDSELLVLKGAGFPEAVPINSSPPAFSTRARRRAVNYVGERETPRIPSSTTNTIAPLTSTSALSALGTTPVLTSSTTPATQDSPPVMKPKIRSEVDDKSSPSAAAKSRRRDFADALPSLKAGRQEHPKASSRATRQQRSNSTDELARSSANTPALDQSLNAGKLGTARSGRNTTSHQPSAREQSLRGSGIFEGMAFAISFQSKKPGESADHFFERIEFSKTLGRRITQAGARVLANGFDELFEIVPPKSATTSPITSSPSHSGVRLVPDAEGTGFTALIADGHSRKVKYMQALALGLPCVATRWVTTCLDRNELVDWSPYLLCAGVSSFLGDAIRSRSLVPYDAAHARLADVIDHRPRFLEGSRILLIMKKAEEGKKMAYVFLAQVLGASLSRVHSLQEARSTLKAAEDLGQSFDWVYLDDKADKGEELFGAPAAAPEGKKRKRASTLADPAPPPKKIRTLRDELVIQSLILGRLIEEGEMED